MRTRLTLKPGQRGTRRLCDEYGDRLVRVRYRYDDARKVRVKTVELIVDERPWAYCKAFRPIPFDQAVLIAIPPGDRHLRRDILAAGGIWRPEHQACEVKYHVAERQGIHGLLIVERAPRPKGRGVWRPKLAGEQAKHVPVYSS